MKNIFTKWRKQSPDASDVVPQERLNRQAWAPRQTQSQQSDQTQPTHPKQTFRVQGLPSHWQGTTSLLRASLAHHFGISDPWQTIHIHPIVPESHRRSCTATITFDENPSQLQTLQAGSAWTAPPRYSYTKEPSLTIDKDFWSITTLAAPSNALVE